jgi:precorrin-3B synthase
MSVAPSRKGWCPSLLSPMQSGDGWLVRIKPTAATVSASAARVIAEGASRHGNGHIDLTSRANFQIRGLTSRSAQRLAENIIDQGLAGANPSFEGIRNVMASPLGPDDLSAMFDSHATAHDIEIMLGEEPMFAALPSKFGFLVDGGGVAPLADVTADIMVRASAGSFSVQLDGGTLAATCSGSALVATVKALALAFLRLSWEHREPPSRMRTLIMTTGEQSIFDAARLRPLPLPSTASPVATSPIGFIPHLGQGRGAFGVGLPFGRTEAHVLATLAGLSEKFGYGTLRTTPWRALLIPGVATEQSAAFVEAVGELGLVTDAAEPRLAIFACVGAPACTSASVDARGDARALAASYAAKGLSIHVSGCAKGCAHSSPAALTLVGRDGRYDLVRNGSAGDPPALTGLNVEQIIAEEHVEEGPRP